MSADSILLGQIILADGAWRGTIGGSDEEPQWRMPFIAVFEGGKIRIVPADTIYQLSGCLDKDADGLWRGIAENKFGFNWAVVATPSGAGRERRMDLVCTLGEIPRFNQIEGVHYDSAAVTEALK